MTEEEIPEEKECTICGKEKALEEFGDKKGGLYGKRSHCKDCHNKKNRSRYLLNDEFRHSKLQNERLRYMGQKVKSWWDVESREIRKTND